MAFHHFHKHSKKYLMAAAAVMVFGLVTFNIPSALRAFTGSQTGLGGESWVRFKTSSGRQVEYTLLEWSDLERELRGLLSAMPELFFDIGGVESLNDYPMIHAILLAEAEEMGIVIPDSLVEDWHERFVQALSLQLQRAGQPLTKGFLSDTLRRVGLTESTFRHRLKEALASYLYRATVRGVDVHDPSDILLQFARTSEEVRLEYVAFPFAKYRELLQEELPGDEELAAYFEGLDQTTVDREFSDPQRLSLDFAVLDTESFDPAALPEGTLDDVALDDETVLATYRKDSVRYGAGGAEVASAADIPAEARAKVERDLQIRTALLEFRDEVKAVEDRLRTAESSLPSSSQSEEALLSEILGEKNEEAPPEEPQDAQGGSTGETGEDETAAPQLTPEEIAQQSAAEFQRIAAAYGMELLHVSGKPVDELADLDPPADPNLPFLVGGVFKPGELRVVEAARDRKYAYVMKFVDRLPVTRKTLEEARPDLVEHWLDEHGRKRAEEAARAFRKDVRDASLAELGAETVAGIVAAREAETQEIEQNAKLSEAEKESQLEVLRQELFLDLGAVLGGREAPRFEEIAARDGLERQGIDYFRRDISRTPYFRERYQGVERFLMGQDSPSSQAPRLLGFARDTVSDVLVDTDTQAAYVVRVLDRQKPPAESMTHKDRIQAEDAAERSNLEQGQVPYLSMFSVHTLARLHQPEIRQITRTAPAPPPAVYY